MLVRWFLTVCTPSGVCVLAEGLLGAGTCGLEGILPPRRGILTDEVLREYTEQQEGEPVHERLLQPIIARDSRFVIDYPTKVPPSRR
jgi:hypothetical protein